MTMNNAILCNVTSCNPAEFNRRFGRKQFLRLQGKSKPRQPLARRKHSAQRIAPLAGRFFLGYFFRNVGELSLDDKVAHPRRLDSSKALRGFAHPMSLTDGKRPLPFGDVIGLTLTSTLT
jgi:hypothetical protein